VALACAAVGTVAGPRAAAADEPVPSAFSVSWSAPAGCPDRDTVERKVRSLLGSSPATSEPIAAAGEVTAAPNGGFSLTLETTQRAQTHRRTLAAPRCEELSDAGALIVALAVDPKLVVPAPTADGAPQEPPANVATFAEPEPTLSEPPLAAPPRDAAHTPTTPRPLTKPAHTDAASPFELRVLASALGDVGTLPRPAGGVSLGAGVAHDGFRIEAGGAFLPFARQVIAEAPERGGDVLLLAGGLRGCFSPIRSVNEAGACAGLEAGALGAESFNATAHNDQRWGAWFAGRLGLMGRVALSQSLALAVDLEALVPVPAARPKFVIEPTGLVHQPAPVVGRLAVGLELAFFRRKRPAMDTKDETPWLLPQK
jgi:hypothetical protein